MTKSVLEFAKNLMRRRKFGSAITLLQQYYEYYKGTFEYYLMLGTSCLYVGDIGNAMRNYEYAREIKITNSELLLGQAVIFLRKGETDRALQYYLDILNFDPNNTTAREAMEFIRGKGDYKTICEWAESGRLMRFYPPLGVNPDVIRNCVLAGLLLGACISVGIIIGTRSLRASGGKNATSQSNPAEKNFQRLELTKEESRNAEDKSVSSGEVHFMLSGNEINRSYEAARNYVKSGRDNAARVEINRIMSSNAHASIKKKADDLRVLLKVPTFDSLKDNYSYVEVENDHMLYNGCYVIWAGRISNMQTLDDGSVRFDLLEGYEDMKRVEGLVPVTFHEAPVPPLDNEKPIRILGIVGERNGRVVLEEKAYYQPVKGNTL